MILSTDDLAARRLARLSSSHRRDGLAQMIDALLLAADAASNRSRVSVDRASLHANSPRLHEVAAQLRSSAPLDPHGIAALARMLTDGTGPVYTGDAAALSRRIDQITAELAPRSAQPRQAA